MNFEIELRPHVGQCTSTGEAIELNQYLIVVTGPDLQRARGKPEEMIGYVGKDAGNPINYLKVAAVFGEPTVKIFSQMIRAALLAKAKDRMAEATRAAEDAQRLREETDEFIESQREAGTDEAAANEAVQLVNDAITAANEDLQTASELARQEESANRVACEPDGFYGEAAGQPSESLPVDAANSTAGDDELASEADLQNL